MSERLDFTMPGERNYKIGAETVRILDAESTRKAFYLLQQQLYAVQGKFKGGALMYGGLAMGGNKITGVSNSETPADDEVVGYALLKDYVASAINGAITALGVSPSTPLSLVISSAVPGKPAAGQEVCIFSATQAVNFPANFAGSDCTWITAPTATATYAILKNGVQVGSLTIYPSGSFQFTMSTMVSLASGDRLTITAPNPQDATLSDVSISLVGQLA